MRRYGLETWLVDFNSGKTQLVLFDQSHDTGANDVKMNGSVLEEKLSFKKLELTFLNSIGARTIFIGKTASKKIGALIGSMKFLMRLPYIYKSTISPCIECCCHVRASTSSCHLELLDKLQKRIC